MTEERVTAMGALETLRVGKELNELIAGCEPINAKLSEEDATEEFKKAAKKFLRGTYGLKLKSGVVTSDCRAICSKIHRVLLELEGL